MYQSFTTWFRVNNAVRHNIRLSTLSNDLIPLLGVVNIFIGWHRTERIQFIFVFSSV